MKPTIDWDFPFREDNKDTRLAKTFFQKHDLKSVIRKSSSGHNHLRIEAEASVLDTLALRAYLNDDLGRLRVDTTRLFFNWGFNRLGEYKFKDGKINSVGEWELFTDGSQTEIHYIKNRKQESFEIEWFLSPEVFRDSHNYFELLRLDEEINMVYSFEETQYNTTKTYITIKNATLLDTFVYSAILRDEKTHFRWKLVQELENSLKLPQSLYTHR
jgi:hypothetical protein